MPTFTVPTRADDRPLDRERGHVLPDSPDAGDAAATASDRSSSGAGDPRLRLSDRPWFRRGSLAALLLGAAALYLIGLSASGYANSFYAAAAQAGSQSWKAFFFGSLDAANVITVDKPPFSLWLMALSIRVFGLSSWSLLVPQALLGVATVGVVFVSVRRTAGHWAGLLAGVLLALTPVATLMFRFDNPDAMLVFLLALATYFVLRATEKASAKSMVVAGVLVGLAFLTKMLQAFLVLPVFALVYLIAAPTTLKKRVVHLLAAFGAMIIAAGWWVAVVELVPASWRPYVGGSTDNSILNLTLGYNGLGRILGQGGGAGGGGGGASFGSEVGLTRMFAGVSGGMVSWLIPAALVLGGTALVLRRRAPRTDVPRAALIAWLGSLVVTAAVFSFMAGTYHDYYTIALAPGIAGTIAVAGTLVWRLRDRWSARVALAAAMALTTVWGVVLLGQATGGYADLRWVVGVAGGLVTVGSLVVARLAKPFGVAVLALAAIGGLTGPAAYTLHTAATPHQGSIVTAGPVESRGLGGMGAGRTQRFGGQRPGGTTGQPDAQGGPGGFLGGTPGGQTGTTPTTPGQTTPGQTAPGQTGTTQTRGGIGGMGGGTANADVVTLLNADAGSFTWVAATTGSGTAATYQLATEHPVIAIGGFNGGDPAPTLDQFKADVAAGRVHYYLAGNEGGGGGFGGRGSSSATEIATWVTQNFTATTVGNATVYDLTAAR